MNRLFRWLPIVLAALIIAACGPEAPPRAARSTPIPGPGRLRPSGVTVVPAPAPAGQDAAGEDARSQGDPGAPITVIEYGDFQ